MERTSTRMRLPYVTLPLSPQVVSSSLTRVHVQVGPAAETQAGIRIYEVAQRARVQHYVWAGLAYVLKVKGSSQLFSRSTPETSTVAFVENELGSAVCVPLFEQQRTGE